jgi:hypothetical protein
MDNYNYNGPSDHYYNLNNPTNDELEVLREQEHQDFEDEFHYSEHEYLYSNL